MGKLTGKVLRDVCFIVAPVFMFVLSALGISIGFIYLLVRAIKLAWGS